MSLIPLPSRWCSQCDEEAKQHIALEMDKYRTLELSRVKLEQAADQR
jgi:hypothetical protein